MTYQASSFVPRYLIDLLLSLIKPRIAPAQDPMLVACSVPRACPEPASHPSAPVSTNAVRGRLLLLLLQFDGDLA